MKSESVLKSAAKDFRFLLNRGYSRRSALVLVGNRHELSAAERDILNRGVFSREDSQRKKKRIPLSLLPGFPLAVDGHNVIITVESALRGLPLVWADDGFIRDIARAARGYAPSSVSSQALDLICTAISRHRPPSILFLLDSPVSRSGELAATIRKYLSRYDLTGTAKAVPVPEKLLKCFEGAVATSDSVIIDNAKKVLDLAGYIIRYRLNSKNLIRIS